MNHPHLSPKKRSGYTALILLTSTVIVFGTLAFVWLPRAHAAPHASVNVTLLLVHGYNDTCDYAFNQTDQVPNTGPNATTTINYLTTHGWSASNIDDIGYYNPQTVFSFPRFNGSTASGADGTHDQVASDGNTFGQCDHNLYTFSTSTGQNDVAHCPSIDVNAGTDNEHIQTLACVLSWYIFNTYTASGRPVSIVAHSMGGLIVRDALTEAGHNPQFSPQLDVRNVVTVGTPHGGLNHGYLSDAMASGETTEIDDMAIGSNFLSLLHPQAPQGTVGTYWALMGADVLCLLTGSTSQQIACQVTHQFDYWPDGDTVVQGESAMAMNANYKVLYGEGSERDIVNPFASIYTADTSTEYAHSSNTCPNFAIFHCLTYPFYLNDGSGGNVGVWLCTANCTANIADFTGNGNGTAPHSLANIVAQLGATVVPGPSPNGWMVSIGGSKISGWACDNTNGNNTSQIDFYADAPYGQTGSHYLGGVIADTSRSDLVTAGVCGSTPKHGFAYDARTAGTGHHPIWAYNKVSGTVTPLGNPGNVASDVGTPYPVGYFEGGNGSNVSGWACDNTTVTTASQIDFYADAPFGQAGAVYLGGTIASDPRSDLVTAGVCGSTPNHGFTFTASTAGSGLHKIWAYNKVSGTVTLLGNSGNVTASNAPPLPAGWMVNDSGNNTGLVVSGWACDNAFGGATSQLDFYADAAFGQPGSIYLGGTLATISRSDLVAAGVCGSTPSHGFTYYAHVSRGVHPIWAYNKVSNTVTLLGNSGNVIVDNEPSGCSPLRCN